MKAIVKAGSGHLYFRVKYYWRKYKNMLGLIAFAIFILVFAIHMLIPSYAVIINNLLKAQ